MPSGILFLSDNQTVHCLTLNSPKAGQQNIEQAQHHLL